MRPNVRLQIASLLEHFPAINEGALQARLIRFLAFVDFVRALQIQLWRNFFFARDEAQFAEDILRNENLNLNYTQQVLFFE